MPGRRILTATSRRAVAVVDDGLVHLRDRGGGDRRPELDEVILELAAERLLDRAARLRHARTAAACPADARRSPASSGPMTSARVARNWPSLM